MCAVLAATQLYDIVKGDECIASMNVETVIADAQAAHEQLHTHIKAVNTW